MVSLEAYRAAIGGFCPSPSAKLCKNVATHSSNPTFAPKIVFVLLLLLLCGDVESNPGPANEMSEETRAKLFAKLKDLKRLVRPKSVRPTIPANLQNSLLKKLNDTLSFVDPRQLNKVVKDSKYYAEVLRKLANKRLSRVVATRKVFKPNLINIATSDDPFLQQHLVFEDAELQIYIRRLKFVSQQNFGLKDYQYQIKVREKQNATPTIYKLITQLHQALIDITDELKQQLSPELHSQIYFCLIHSGLGSNLNTGNYDLFNTSSEDIINQVITTFESILISWQALALNSSFELRIKVISVEHMKDRARKGFVTKDFSAGAPKVCSKNILSNKTNRSLLCLPEDDPRFDNRCLPAVVLLGYYRKKHLRHLYNKSCPQESAIYTNICRINHTKSRSGKNKAQSRRARATLLALVNEFCAEIGYSPVGPYQTHTFLTKAAEHLGVQFHVYSNLGNRRNFCYPSTFDDAKPLIYLYEETYDREDVAHVSLILNIGNFMKNVGYICQYCNKKRFGRVHSCRQKGAQCFPCKRYRLINTTTYVDAENKTKFCDKLALTRWKKNVLNAASRFSPRRVSKSIRH